MTIEQLRGRPLPVRVRTRSTQKEARVTRIGLGSAEVEVKHVTTRDFVTATGKHVRFTSTSERTFWALGTEVEVL